DTTLTGSISTLPIGWPSEVTSPAQLEQAGRHLRSMADHLKDLESRTGRRIVVAIEPEPGCIIDTVDDVTEWFHTYLPEDHHRRYLTVCHDICHSAVMMESQSAVLNRLAQEGIGIGKIQVSSAIVADWESMGAQRQREAMDQLRSFAEDRYLHQTGRQTREGQFLLAEDLPDLVGGENRDAVSPADDRKWVVHFHVPVFLERFGHLATSQAAVWDCLRTLSENRDSNEAKIEFTGHLEIETYAWTVLPESMRQRGLAEDIASEVTWLQQIVSELPPE
ncbi:MAG: xylose isomerase, partial [Pirellulales bacterium]|nr:xylose isomerase [Pirellulales bacterium]